MREARSPIGNDTRMPSAEARTAISRLSARPLVAIGLVSYSLYLWQQLFLNRYSGAWVNAFPQNIILSVAAALASYFIVEKPLLGLRHRLRARSVHHGAGQRGKN